MQQQLHAKRRHVLCVTTTNPSSSSTSMAVGSSGALTLICPRTGSISASLSVSGDLSSTTASSGQQLGVSSLSLFPSRISDALHPTRAPLALAYGSRNTKQQDAAALLVSLSHPTPKVHWKSRLPEVGACLVVSQCGHYAIGGGNSGSLYVWSTLTGHLLQTVPRAHYRAVTCSLPTKDGRHVLSASQDGMVHLFALMDLVENNHNNGGASKAVAPIRTWSQHAVPVTALATVSADQHRFVAASQDGLVTIMEIFSEEVLASIQLSEGVSSLCVQNQRVWVGGSQGTIFGLDLDLYSLHQTLQLGASVAGSSADPNEDADHASYKTEFKGHSPHPVESLVAWSDDTNNSSSSSSTGQDFLASGDASGTVRVWDVSSRVCVRIVRPWGSATATPGTKKTTTQQHPISSLQVLELPETTNSDTALRDNAASATNQKAKGAWASRLPPLQKYAAMEHSAYESNQKTTSFKNWKPVPLWNAQRDYNAWDVTKELEAKLTSSSSNNVARKRPRIENVDSSAGPRENTEQRAPNDGSDESNDNDTAQDDSKDEELKRLKQQLEEAKSTIARWEKVNNQLMAKLQQPSK